MSEVEIIVWGNGDTGQQKGSRVLIACWNLIKATFHLFLEVRER